ncbi:hypothetical protein DPMN_033628 [Dreissena polymorpha]|uniref:Uncharacterized protein n=1 Tax=Dreissena polymorpha TaxID=45954 RepID=A0A9D4M6E1_DREPO|nr:hypothetical protein DPMN_033628 [Dreissena polymorpha]
MKSYKTNTITTLETDHAESEEESLPSPDSDMTYKVALQLLMKLENFTSEKNTEMYMYVFRK